ncbi:Eukaryotic peptide chain release factor GTP-binding subunit [Bienertia sinuspersici]
MSESCAKPIVAVNEFIAQLQILELLDNVNNLICVEKFSDFPQLGRFTLRTEGKTVAVGKITELPTIGNSA